MDGRIIRYSVLETKGACSDYKDQFAQSFGNEVLLTVEQAIREAVLWDWEWAAENLLSATGFQAWKVVHAPAMDAYDTTVTPLRYAWNNARRRYESFFGATVSEREAARRASEAAYDVYYTVSGTARQELREIQARAFAELYIQEGEKGE